MKKRPTESRDIFPAALLAKLDLFTEKLTKWNRKFSLTSIPEDKIFEKLVAPSAWLGLEYGKEKIGTIADFGSGPGIPGIPMALADPNNRYLLIDSNEKKIGFVKSCLATTDLFEKLNVKPVCEKIYDGSWSKPADRVVNRGSGSFLHVTGLWEKKVKPGGVIDFYKGSDADGESAELKHVRPHIIIERIKTPGWFRSLRLYRVTNWKR